jgi:hypothetical protein
MFCFLGLELTSRPGTQGEFRFLTCDFSEVFDGSSRTDYQLIMRARATRPQAVAAFLTFLMALLPASCVTAATPEARCGPPANPRSRNLR